jgi:carbamoyl-phosphate synthase large subunit
MSRVLVTGASGIVGYGILRSLQKSALDYFLVGSSIYEDSVAPAFCDVFEQAPMTSSPDYSSWLITTVSKYKIDIVIPGIEADMYHFAANYNSLVEAGVRPMLNRESLVLLCKDKWRFYTEAERAGLSCLILSKVEGDFLSLSCELGLPFLLKPREGFGSKGIKIVKCEADFDLYGGNLGSKLMAQPIVGDDENEFTIGAFCDGAGGYFAAICLRRSLSNSGFTAKAEVTDISPFEPSLKELCGVFKPEGPTNFQFRLGVDGPLILEINPRISSSTSIRTAFGYNESQMAVDYYLKRIAPTQPDVLGGVAVRYNDEVIFYEDSINI